MNQERDTSHLIKDKDIKLDFNSKNILIIIGVFLLSLIIPIINKSNLLTFVQVGALSLLLTYISLIDIKTHLCPNWPNLVILALAIPNIIINISEQYYFGLINMLLGALFGFLPLFLSALFTKRGIGGADIKIMTTIGFLVGPSKIIAILFASLLMSIIFMVIKGIKNKNMKNTAFAFLPYISICTLIILPLGI